MGKRVNFSALRHHPTPTSPWASWAYPHRHDRDLPETVSTTTSSACARLITGQQLPSARAVWSAGVSIDLRRPRSACASSCGVAWWIATS
jgi:hypothetical protein